MKFYRNFVIFWSIIYLFFAFSGRFFSEKKEWVPFFRWSLYSKSYDELKMSYVIVTKLGDSVFAEPKRLMELKPIHKLSKIHIYDEFLKINKDLEQGKAFDNLFFNNFFEKGSEYIMYSKTFDLSKENYSEPKIEKQLEYKNDKMEIYVK